MNRELKRIGSNSAKLRALKDNIGIRVLGLGWSDLATPWSRNGRDLSGEELSNHLKNIISHERKRMIPDKPPVQIPERKKLQILGTATQQLTVIEECNKLKLSGFEKHARNLKVERELVGVGDSYTNMQPQSMPKIDISLVGR